VIEAELLNALRGMADWYFTRAGVLQHRLPREDRLRVLEYNIISGRGLSISSPFSLTVPAVGCGKPCHDVQECLPQRTVDQCDELAQADRKRIPWMARPWDVALSSRSTER
jgi:hypothetical protein